MFGNGRDVGAQGEDFRARGHDVVGGDVVAEADHDVGFEHVAGRVEAGEFLQRHDVRAAQDFDALAVFRREHEQVPDGRRIGGQFRLGGRGSPCGGIGELAVQGGLGGGQGADQIDLGVLGAAAPLEVAVEGTGAHASGDGRAAGADARPAGAFEQARAGVDERLKEPFLRQHGEHLLGAGGDHGVGAGVDAAPAEDLGDQLEVGVRGVRTGTDTDLLDGQAVEFGYGHHAVGHVRLRGQRNQRGKIDGFFFIIRGVGVGAELQPVGFAAHGLEEGAGHAVGGEESARGAEFRAHVGDGGAFRHGKGGDAGPGVFKHAAHAALDGAAAEQFEDDVLGGSPAGERPGQEDAHDLGHGDIIRLARHRQRDGKPARAHSERTDAARGGGVAVGTHEGRAGLGEVFKVELVADAGAGPGVHAAEFGRHGAQETVVVGVAEVHLERVVIHVAQGNVGLDPWDAQSLELEPCHSPGGVLGQGLVDAQTDFASGRHGAGNKVTADDFLCEVHMLPFCLDCVEAEGRTPTGPAGAKGDNLRG